MTFSKKKLEFNVINITFFLQNNIIIKNKYILY